jgi:hypothetical protein
MKIIGSDKGIHSPEFHKKKTRERRLKQALTTLVLAFVVGAPIYIARTGRLLITSVEISGNSVTKSESIQEIVAENLAGNYLWIFPHSNTLIYPKQKIIRELREREPRLRDISITRTSTKSLKVEVTERDPAAEYCTDTENPATPQDCYFIDDTGYIFASAPAFSGNVYLTYTHDEPYTDPIGKTVLLPNTFEATREFTQGLGDLGIHPRVFLIKGDEYHLILTNGTEILWNRTSELNDIRSNLEAFLRDGSIKDEADFLKRVLYLDLRFENKIFYKFRDNA